ncbi:hypothetical protein RNZ50_22305 [Paracoccaceae bacterium Fryx2]|nr:hypothetical protein [Paracoccaceae bacterium Fryx2]
MNLSDFMMLSGNVTLSAPLRQLARTGTVSVAGAPSAPDRPEVSADLAPAMEDPR